jgi:hypothetical protein
MVPYGTVASDSNLVDIQPQLLNSLLSIYPVDNRAN